MHSAGSSPPASFVSAQRRLDTLIEGHAGWQRLEQTVGSLGGVDEEERAALWLYAWWHSRPAHSTRRSVAVASD